MPTYFIMRIENDKAAIKNKSSLVSNEKFKSSYQNRRLLTLKLISFETTMFLIRNESIID